MSEDVEALEDK